MPRETPDETLAYLVNSALRLTRLCRKHFKISGEPDQLAIDEELRPTAVSDFLREYRASIRPENLRDERVLPGQSNVTRAFLWTPPIADVVLNDVVRLSMYSDQIVLIDPFSKHFLKRRFDPPPEGPQVRPENWIQQFANWSLMMCALEPWFREQVVILVPSPHQFLSVAPPFWRIAEAALARGDLPVNPEAVEEEMLGAAALTVRNDAELSALLRHLHPDVDAARHNDLLRALSAYRAANPTRYTSHGWRHASLIAGGSGQNIFEATWIADTLGAYLVPRAAGDRWLFQNAQSASRRSNQHDRLATAFAAAELPMLNNVTLADALDVRRSGRLAGFRSFLHEVWEATSNPDASGEDPQHDARFIDRLRHEHSNAASEWRSIYKDLGVRSVTALFAAPMAQVAQGGLIPAAIAASGWLWRTWSTSARNFRRLPSALLVELENRNAPNPIRRVLARLERHA